MLFPPAPAAGGTGCGACQAGHHDGAECHHRGTWTPQSASHRVYSPFIPLIYHNQRATLTLAGFKEWRPQGSGSPSVSWAWIHLGLSPQWVPNCLPVPKLKGCQTCLKSTSNLISPVLPPAFGVPLLRGVAVRALQGQADWYGPRLLMPPRGPVCPVPLPWQRSALLWPPGIRTVSTVLLM